MKAIIKSLLARSNYRVVRRGRLNRFQAMDDSLTSLARRGLSPTVVVDGGANVGDFARKMLALFPQARIHAVEPQPGCRAALERLVCEAGGRVVYHCVALSAPDRHGTTMAMATDEEMRSTGAHLTPGRADGRLTMSLETLDRRLVPYLSTCDRVLLKLDLQGYELEALRGATTTLAQTDCVVSEVSFYRQAYEPPIVDLVGFLAEHNFELDDVAALYARPRDNRPRQGDFIFLNCDCAAARDTRWS